MTQISSINPATEETISQFDLMDEKTEFSKIEAAHAAFLNWKVRSHEERAPYLRDIAKTLRKHADNLAELMTKETGKLLRDGKTEV
ncbi:MAG: aldehyde dehydrogenase family protein, partial [Roseovarius sp.]|nr:aldehyde dehydrogenase family protein [Roseovarius sp.]